MKPTDYLRARGELQRQVLEIQTRQVAKAEAALKQVEEHAAAQAAASARDRLPRIAPRMVDPAPVPTTKPAGTDPFVAALMNRVRR